MSVTMLATMGLEASPAASRTITLAISFVPSEISKFCPMTFETLETPETPEMMLPVRAPAIVLTESDMSGVSRLPSSSCREPSNTGVRNLKIPAKDRLWRLKLPNKQKCTYQLLPLRVNHSNQSLPRRKVQDTRAEQESLALKMLAKIIGGRLTRKQPRMQPFCPSFSESIPIRRKLTRLRDTG